MVSSLPSPLGYRLLCDPYFIVVDQLFIWRVTFRSTQNLAEEFNRAMFLVKTEAVTRHCRVRLSHLICDPWPHLQYHMHRGKEHLAPQKRIEYLPSLILLAQACDYKTRLPSARFVTPIKYLVPGCVLSIIRLTFKYSFPPTFSFTGQRSRREVINPSSSPPSKPLLLFIIALKQ